MLPAKIEHHRKTCTGNVDHSMGASHLDLDGRYTSPVMRTLKDKTLDLEPDLVLYLCSSVRRPSNRNGEQHYAI